MEGWSGARVRKLFKQGQSYRVRFVQDVDGYKQMLAQREELQQKRNKQTRKCAHKSARGSCLGAPVPGKPYVPPPNTRCHARSCAVSKASQSLA